MLFILHLLVLSPLALLRAYPLSERGLSIINYSSLQVASPTEGNGLGGDRTPQGYPNVVAPANMGYLNENTPSGADVPNYLISFYGADSNSIAPSKPAQSHDGYCRDSLPNKLCCDDDVGTRQNQEDLRANCEICKLTPPFMCFVTIEADLMILQLEILLHVTILATSFAAQNFGWVYILSSDPKNARLTSSFFHHF